MFDPQNTVRGSIYLKFYYRLARRSERTGQKDGAAEDHSEFLDSCKDADRNLPEMVDARQRIAELTLKKGGHR